MKFNLIFILFNITFLILLALIVLLSLALTGYYPAGFFWQINWPFFVIWILLLTGFNVFYFSNRRLFSLLEREDWPALVNYLEDRVIQKGSYTSYLVRLLAYSYLVLSDSASVLNLENKVALAKPALLDTHALIFGTTRILARDFSGAVRFFEARREGAKTAAAQKDWICWYHGFALLLDHRIEQAADNFSLLAQGSKNGIITALSSYFLKEFAGSVMPAKASNFLEVSQKGRERVLMLLPSSEDWNRLATRLNSEIHVAVISKYLKESGYWVFNA